MSNKFLITKASLKDVSQIYKLINFYAKKNLMLERSLNQIYENLRDFWICKNKDTLLGCCALHIVGWRNLGEIRSLAVKPRFKKRGIGSRLVEMCLQEAKQLQLDEVFVLTFVPNFFEKLGFRRIKKEKLPHKIWSECINCPLFPDKCKEVALIKKL